MDTPVNRALVDIQRTSENKECHLSGLLNLTFLPSFLSWETRWPRGWFVGFQIRDVVEFKLWPGTLCYVLRLDT